MYQAALKKCVTFEICISNNRDSLFSSNKILKTAIFARESKISPFFLSLVASDDDVPRTITDIFHDIVQLGNRIRNRIASWKNTFMSVRRRRKRLFEAREYLVLLKDALDRIKEPLYDERDIIDCE